MLMAAFEGMCTGNGIPYVLPLFMKFLEGRNVFRESSRVMMDSGK
jgi:hypothetical protein